MNWLIVYCIQKAKVLCHQCQIFSLSFWKSCSISSTEAFASVEKTKKRRRKAYQHINVSLWKSFETKKKSTHNSLLWYFVSVFFFLNHTQTKFNMILNGDKYTRITYKQNNIRSFCICFDSTLYWLCAEFRPIFFFFTWK